MALRRILQIDDPDDKKILKTRCRPVRLPNPALKQLVADMFDTMHAAWVAFATRGDPGWPKYELKRRATIRFDITSEVVDDPRSGERALWEGLR